MSEYRYSGAHALVSLHELHLRRFVETWRQAHTAGISLPVTDDPTYQSYDTLLHHVIGWSRKYLFWICDKLETAIPNVPPTPEADELPSVLDRHLEQLLDGWRKPLVNIPIERFIKPEFQSPWHTRYCIDAMLEHAVMHPIRHRHQLSTLIEVS